MLKGDIKENVPELVVGLAMKIVAREIDGKSTVKMENFVQKLLPIEQRDLPGDFFGRMSGHVEIPVAIEVVLSGSTGFIGSNAARDLGFWNGKLRFEKSQAFSQSRRSDNLKE